MSEDKKLLDLVAQAFAMARDRGKRDWTQMQVSVLKNRMLALDPTFDESQYGAKSFRELIARVPFVSIGADAAVLTDETVVSGLGSTRDRVRPDLWRAVMDYSSGQKYAWDPRLAQARPAKSGDSLILPTIGSDAFLEWRREFAELFSRELTNAPAGWLEGKGGTNVLPPKLRGEWNGFLRNHVVSVLENWFKTQPEMDRPALVAHVATSELPEIEDIRRAIIRCIDAMTLDELQGLHLPASAVARAFKR